MKATGPEFCYLASVKLQLQGERKVILANFSGLLEYYNRTHASESSSVALARVMHTLEHADARVVGTMRRHVQFLQAHIGPNSALWLPAGWIIVEQVENGNLVHGVRWLCLPDVADNNHPAKGPWRSLLNLVKPKAGAEMQKRTHQVGELAFKAILESCSG